MIMEDMKVAGCSPNAVTCSVVLVTLGSKCCSSNEVSHLLQGLERFESEPMQCCCSLLTDPTRRDEEVYIPHFPQRLSMKIGYADYCFSYTFSHFVKVNRVIFELKGTFCQELIPYDFPLFVLHTKAIIYFYIWCILGGSVQN